jgi:hypothetical protein
MIRSALYAYSLSQLFGIENTVKLTLVAVKLTGINLLKACVCVRSYRQYWQPVTTFEA